MDAVYLPFHKANQFLGTNVMKLPNIEHDAARYEQHLAKVIKAR